MVSLVSRFSQAPAAHWRRPAVGVFFGILLLLGGWLHRDYGVSWDEPNNHLNGLVTIKYLASLLPLNSPLRNHPTFATTPDIHNFPDAHHGPAFEVAVIAMSYLLTDHDSRSYFLMRHFMVFSMFLLGVWALYRLGTYWLRDWRWGLLGAGLMVLSPRFFAEGFYNGKDIVYMACFTLAMLTLVRLLRRPTLGRAVAHGLATALTIDIRVHGVQLLLFTALALLLAWRYAAPVAVPVSVSRGRLYLVYVGTALTAALAGWPYLWAYSLPELLAISSHAVRYPWVHTNFYLGQHVPVSQLPWHYVPIWMGVTIPVPYSLAAAVGLLAAVRRGQQPGVPVALDTEASRLGVVVALWLLGPLLLVVSTNMVVYEGWRHLYYLYPALLLWAVQGVRVLVRLATATGAGRAVAQFVLALGALETGHTAVRIAQMHPHQNVYFSFLPGAIAERLFERDYWGLAYRQGLEWLLAHDSAPILTISVLWHHPLGNNMRILPPHDRTRLRYAPGGTGRYYLTAYRWHAQSYLDSLGQEVHVIRKGGVKILSVFKRY